MERRQVADFIPIYQLRQDSVFIHCGSQKEGEEGVMSWVLGCELTSCDGRGEHSRKGKLLLVFTVSEQGSDGSAESVAPHQPGGQFPTQSAK